MKKLLKLFLKINRHAKLQNENLIKLTYSLLGTCIGLVLVGGIYSLEQYKKEKESAYVSSYSSCFYTATKLGGPTIYYESFCRNYAIAYSENFIDISKNFDKMLENKGLNIQVSNEATY